MFKVLDYMPVGAFVISQDWTILFWNRRMEEWTGISREQILNQKVAQHIPQLLHPRYATRIKDVLNNGTPTILSSHLHHCVLPITLLNGQQQIQHTTIMPMPIENGEGFYALFSIEDVTELTARTVKYREMRDKAYQAEQRAEQANAAKSRFLANMSHELRTPLNSILGFAQVLEHDPTLTPQHKYKVQNIQRGGDYLLTLINDVLDFAKIEADRFELFPRVWETQPFFQGLSDMFWINAEKKGIHFFYESLTQLPVALYCDDKRLRQIIINLLSNAIKFTEQGSVTLTSGFNGGVLEIQVIDTGIGIAEDQCKTIFQAFTQTGEAVYKQQGTGLGLSITYHLVGIMKGTLEVDSTVGEGSAFRVRLPVEVVSTLPEAQQNSRYIVTGYERLQGQGAFKVLMTEDLADNREVLRNLLEPLNFVIIEAESGERCLELVPQWQPDVILMDLRLPQMNGLETTRALRQQPEWKQIPIIAVSAGVFGEDRQRALEAGCNAHISKPVMLPILLDTLQAHLPLSWKYAPTSFTSNGDGNAVDVNTQKTFNTEQVQKLDNMLKRGAIKEILNYLQKLVQTDNAPPETEELLLLAQRFQLSHVRERLKNLTKSQT